MEPLKTTDLTRETAGTKKTVVFVGNGAIQGGWGPLRSVLDKVIDADPDIHLNVKALRKNNSEAFHQLAILSYKFKVTRGELFQTWQKGELPIQTEKKGLHNLIQGFLDLRDQIAGEYSSLRASLSLRNSNEIKELIGEDAAFVTTNWDETLWSNGEIKNLVQLHGRCSFGHSLMCPTELLVEDTAYDLKSIIPNLQQCGAKFQKQVYSTFRYLAMTSLFFGHVTSSNWLQECERLVIWGYSLGDYDADVNALIGTYMRKKGTELIVINPEKKAFHRAVALTGITSAMHFDPVTGNRTSFL